MEDGIGKTITTGLIALYFKKQGLKVITQKIVQTGCKKVSEDIIKHREIMGEDLNKFDLQGLTCPYIFKFPASPHLAAKLENKEINPEIIFNATKELEKHFNLILLEGVGGLQVPLNKHLTLIDYIAEKGYSLVLVTSGKLGSINHTLLSLEAIKNRNIELKAIVFNNYFSNNEVINTDIKDFFKKYLSVNFPKTQFFEIDDICKYSNDKKFLYFNI